MIISIPKEFKRKNDLEKAINEFISKEKFLLEKGVNERSLTHKLAEYLQKYFKDYDVDCEYNRMMKSNTYVAKTLLLNRERIYSDDLKQVAVYPDIIIHKRGTNNDNFLVIEVKKENNNSNKEFDFEKLKAFTTELNYKWGLYLEFDEKQVLSFIFFKDGKKLIYF